MANISRKITRVYRHYEELEEYHAGMWRIVRGEQRKTNAEASANLMRDSGKFKAAMARALVEWPVSCSVALTVEAANRIAWLGHAGCCLGVGSPEENTRNGWHQLNFEEQAEANRTAQEILTTWETSYLPVELPCLSGQLEFQF